MELVHSQPAKTGRSAMLLEPVPLPSAEGVASKIPSKGSAGSVSQFRSARDRGNRPQSAAEPEVLSGLVFIANTGAATVGSALVGTGAVVCITSSVHLRSGEPAEAVFCVANDSSFDTLFKSLREVCRTTSSSGVVFFGSAELPGQMSLRGLSRMNQLTEISLEPDHSQSSSGSEPDAARWLHLTDPSCVRFGQNCPDVGPGFPQNVGLCVERAQLD